MDFIFASVRTFESWDWTNPARVGIGGSETSHIEMSNRLAGVGHNVYSYAPCDFMEPTVNPHNVTWQDCSQIDANKKGIWVIYREPELIDHLPTEGNVFWLICQDVDYPTLTMERAERFDRIVTLCGDHKRYMQAKLKAHTEGPDNVVVSSNGITVKNAIEVPRRNPRRLMYASSPDRGMEYLCEIFPKVREIVPDIELHIYYGFDNIEKVASVFPKVADNMRRLQRMTEQPGITVHGRTGQDLLRLEWMKSGIWAHPSNFTETSCITCMDAQALGAIPVTTPVWAIGENVKHGVFIEGDVRNEHVKARYVNEIAKLALDPERQQSIRGEMTQWAKRTFEWRRFVIQWEEWAIEDQSMEAAA